MPLLKAARERHATLAALLAQGALQQGDFVHDARVAARRLGEMARLLEKFMDKSSARAVDASLKSLRRSMGELRDSDVTREHLAKWRMPHAVKEVAETMAAQLEQGRENLAQAAAQQISSASVQGAMVVLARVIEDRGSPEHAAETERRIEAALKSHRNKREKQLRRAFGRAATKQTAESLHAARIAAKKLRYVVELAADETKNERSGAASEGKFLKRMQKLLGDHHDVHVIVEMLQGHLAGHREAPIARLTVDWRKWRQAMEKGQAKRAGEFFVQSYTWMNR
jgi:CHAD domain-containing protein